MLSHRDGKLVVICDGCYRVVGPARTLTEAEAFQSGRTYALEGPMLGCVTKPGADGPVNGDVCSEGCAERWAKKPIPRRATA